MLKQLLAEFSSPPVLALVLVCVLFGSYIQATIGIGLGLVVVPVVGLVAPSLLPQSVVLAGIPLMVMMLWEERSEANIRRSGWLVVGRAVGVPPALWILGVVSLSSLQVMVGLVTMLAVLASTLVHRAIRITPGSQFVAGALSGLTGTATGIGGAPVALLYAFAPPGVARSALAGVMLLGAIFGVAGYTVGGRIRGVDVQFALISLVPVAAGYLLGRHTRGIVPDRLFRFSVYTVVGLTALALIIRGIDV